MKFSVLTAATASLYLFPPYCFLAENTSSCLAISLVALGSVSESAFYFFENDSAY